MHNLQESNTETNELQEQKQISGHTRSSYNTKPGVLLVEADGGYWYTHNLIQDVQAGQIQNFGCIAVTGFILLAIEVVGAYKADSVAVFSECAHLFSDLMGFGFSALALILAKRKATQAHSYGFHRAEILGVLANCLIVVVFTVILIYISILRLIKPPKIFESNWMMGTAIFGLVVHLIMIKFLHDSGGAHHGRKKSDDRQQLNKQQEIFAAELETWRGRSEASKAKNLAAQNPNGNPNDRAAIIQIFCEILHSIFVVITSLIINMFPRQTIADPVCTQICALISFFSIWSALKSSIYLLMESSPANLCLDEFTEALQTIPGLGDIHDQHVWSLNHDKVAMSAHIRASNADEILQKATVVCRRFGIYHSTIQVENDEQTVRGNDFYIDCGQNIH